MLERLVVSKEEAFVGGHRLDHLPEQRFDLGARSRSASAARSRNSSRSRSTQPRFEETELVRPDHRGPSGSSTASRTSECGGRQRLADARAIRSISSSFGAMRGSGQVPRDTTRPVRPLPACPTPRWSLRPVPPASAGIDDASSSDQPVLAHAGQHRDQHATIARRGGAAQWDRPRVTEPSGGSALRRANRPLRPVSISRCRRPAQERSVL